jgi:hypothetical protein
MRGLLRALLDVGAREFSKLGVPHQVLSAMELSPVPVRAHHSTDEVGVVLVRSSVVDEVARFDAERRRRDRSSSRESDESGKQLHAGVLAYEREE